MSKPIVAMSGRYNKLVVISAPFSRDGKVWYRFRCDCGCEKDIRSADVRYGHTRSCGARSCKEYSPAARMRYLEYSIALLERKLGKKRAMLERLKSGEAIR